MNIAIVMSNGFGGRVEIDESMIDAVTMPEIDFVIHQIRSTLVKCLAHRNEEPPEL